MKTIPPADKPQRLPGEVRLARIQLAKAERQSAEAKAQALRARQRRKAAKLAARQAKKRAKLAVAQVAEAKSALAKLVAQLARPAPIKRKPRKRPPAATVAPTQKTLKTRKPAARSAKSATRDLSVPKFMVTPVDLVSPEDCKPTPQIIEELEKVFAAESVVATPGKSGAPTNLIPSDQDTCPPQRESITSKVINQ